MFFKPQQVSYTIFQQVLQFKGFPFPIFFDTLFDLLRQFYYGKQPIARPPEAFPGPNPKSTFSTRLTSKPGKKDTLTYTYNHRLLYVIFHFTLQ